MCISVQPNGYANARKKYVSAGIHFLMGEYDDHLMWPFPGAIITLTVIASQCHNACSNTSSAAHTLYCLEKTLDMHDQGSSGM